MKLKDRLARAGFFTAGDLLRLPRDLRNFYRDIWHAAEDSGCLPNDPFELKISLYPSPLDSDLTPEVLSGWIQELIGLGKLVPYRAQGRELLWVKNFSSYQKLANPLAPVCPLPEWMEFIPFGSNPRQGKYRLKTPDGSPDEAEGDSYAPLTSPFQTNPNQQNQNQTRTIQPNRSQPRNSSPGKEAQELPYTASEEAAGSAVSNSEQTAPGRISLLGGIERLTPNFREEWKFFRRFPELKSLSFCAGSREEVLAQLKALGVSRKTVEGWLAKCPERIGPQLEHLPFREVESSPAGLLIQAVNQDWDLPPVPQPKTRVCRECGKVEGLPLSEWDNLNREKVFTCRECLSRPLTPEEETAVAEAKAELERRKQLLREAESRTVRPAFAPASG